MNNMKPGFCLDRFEIIDLISPQSKNSADHDIEFGRRVEAAILERVSARSGEGVASSTRLEAPTESPEDSHEALATRRLQRANQIEALRRKLQALLDEEAHDLRGTEPLDLNALRAECARLKKTGSHGIIQAVKFYRSKTGLSLKEAKDAVVLMDA